MTGGEEEEITVVKERTGPVKKGDGVVVGTSAVSWDSRQSGLPTNVGTSDAGKQKNTLTCTSSTMRGKNMMDTNVFTGD